MKRIRKIQVIINPASGHDEPVLNVLNRIFREHGVEWDVSVTRDSGDAGRMARDAMDAGVDIVAGYGGDGTLMEIANALHHSDTPLGVLPGGTGNSIARELGIGVDLAQAAELLCRAPSVRHIDLGRVGERYFLLHAYCGLRKSQRASRQLKNELGIFAYLLQTIKVLSDGREVHYQLSVDGAEIEDDGVVCLIINALSVGLNVAFAKEIKPDDGVLDLILVKRASLAMLPGLLQDRISEEYMRHWRGREIIVRSEVTQELWTDGEEGGSTPFKVIAAPRALRVIVPR